MRGIQLRWSKLQGVLQQMPTQTEGLFGSIRLLNSFLISLSLIAFHRFYNPISLL